MKMHAIYDKHGKIIATNIPGPFSNLTPFEIGVRRHGPHPKKTTELGQMEGVFDIPDELTMLNTVELTGMMENVKVDHEAKKLSIVKK
jgi:hypothetical protein